MLETIDSRLRHNFYSRADVAKLLEQKELRVLNNEQSSFTAARDVLNFYFDKIAHGE